MKTGILLINIGTPEAPTPAAVRRYLKKFLSDPRVVELPRFIWWPILHGFILRFRPKNSAKLYQKIWSDQGSPLLYYSQQIKMELERKLEIPTALGMHYSQPSIQSALEELRAQQVERLLILPLYPQYSGTTTAAAFDAVARVLKTWRKIPEIHLINHYAEDENYLKALKVSIQTALNPAAQHLLFSFHGIPERYTQRGDPYAAECHATAKRIAEKLNLSNWSVAFQSRLGRAKWLSPYTDQVLQAFPAKGIEHIQVVCPGFAADCLETLEEIGIRGKEQFLNAGGKSFHYIPALNNHPLHIEALSQILQAYL